MYCKHMITINEIKFIHTTPWEFLKYWPMCERAPEHNEEWLCEKMKTSWPGNYRVVVKELYPPDRFSEWALEFDNPAEETMFRLRWA